LLKKPEGLIPLGEEGEEKGQGKRKIQLTPNFRKWGRARFRGIKMKQTDHIAGRAKKERILR